MLPVSGSQPMQKKRRITDDYRRSLAGFGFRRSAWSVTSKFVKKNARLLTLKQLQSLTLAYTRKADRRMTMQKISKREEECPCVIAHNCRHFGDCVACSDNAYCPSKILSNLPFCMVPEHAYCVSEGLLARVSNKLLYDIGIHP